MKDCRFVGIPDKRLAALALGMTGTNEIKP